MRLLEKSNGFTVVEILLGIGLFGLVMPVIIMAVVGVGRLNDRAADLTSANIIAEEKIESLRSAGYNSLENGVYGFTEELDPTFTEPRNAEYVIETPYAGVKSIQININYNVYGNQKELTYRALVSELGVAQ